MRLETKHIIAVIFLSCLIALVYKSEEKPVSGWTSFEDKNLGIAFEHPSEIKAFYPQEVNFRECESCPGFIDIKKYTGEFKDVQEAMTNTGYPINNILGEREVDGTTAIFTVPRGSEPQNTDQKTAFVLKGKNFYVINVRWIDDERFWNSLKLD